MSSLLDYCETDSQRRIIELREQGLSFREVAETLGKAKGTIGNTIQFIKARAAKKGWSPDHDMTKTVPDGFAIKGTSTLYGEDGNLKLQWVKTNQDHERQYELMQEAIKALCEDLPELPPVQTKFEATNPSLMAVYPLGDPHIGVLAWGEETGQDWDLKIAEQKFCAVFDRLVKTAPHCDEAVIVNLGDYFHSDNMEGLTTRSGHHLDTDSRFGKMIRVGMKIMRQMISSALQHHKSVRVINATGNHDDTCSQFFAVSLSMLFENDPRVTIDDAPTPFHYVEWGKCMFGVHHGHSCKPAMLPGVMAADMPEMWGRTKHRYWYTGHIHHDTKKEYAGVTQESFRTLAAKDAYATWGGYRSGQDSKCIVLHKEHGEVERHTVNLDMVT